MESQERPKGLQYWDGNEIVNGLLLGSVPAVQRKAAMEYYGINAVLSILTESQMDLQEKLVEHLDSFSISKERGNWLRFDFGDCRLNRNIQSELHEAADFIHRHMASNEERSDNGGSGGSGSVMVHCWAGMSRSPTMVIAFLMKHRAMSCDEALHLVKAQRKVAQPKPYFMEQLLIFQDALNGNNSCCAIL